MLNDLLALFEDDEEDFLHARITRLDYDESAITIDLEVGDEGWEVVCKGVLEHCAEMGGGGIELRDSDPLLMPYHAQRASLSFRGAPQSVHAVIGAMWLAHNRHFGNCHRFGKFLNNYPLDELLSGGFGQLADGPLPLIREYEAVLRTHGVDTFVHVWDSNPYGNRNAKLLVIGSGFVIAEEFSAART
jgi:hypothetical protein